jgi:diguanylate cyclase
MTGGHAEMMELIAAQAAASAAELPFLLLQAAALVGMVSVLILLQRNIALDDARYKIYYGIIFGVTGFLLTLLVSEFIKLPSKPYIRSDLLFLAGVLGSWQGGLISLALVSAGRFLFGWWSGTLWGRFSGYEHYLGFRDGNVWLDAPAQSH